MYRHKTYIESAAFERLAALSAGVASQRLLLEYVPRVHYFREDSAGKFARPIRVSGFIDRNCSPVDVCVFVRTGLSPAETVATVFHECCHVHQTLNGEMGTLPHWQSEQQADLFALRAPSGNFEQIMAKLSREYRQPTPAEVGNAAAERYRRERRQGFEDQRRQLRFQETMYRLEHWREIQAEDEAKRKRDVDKFIDNYLQKSSHWRGASW